MLIAHPLPLLPSKMASWFLSSIHGDILYATVYCHLLLGSENHVDAFWSNLVNFKADCEKDPLVP